MTTVAISAVGLLATPAGATPSPAVRRTVPAAASVAGDSVCGSIPHLDRLVLTRTVEFPKNHFRFRFRFRFPARVTVGRPGQVRAVARVLCALPPMPDGPMSCPADFGIDYHLQFSAPGRRLAPVTADASGCGNVGEVATHDLRASTSFWSTLGRAIDLTPGPGGNPYGYPFGTRRG